MGKKLYVGNLPYSATEQTLIDKFSECGTVDSAKLITDKIDGRTKGFGFVEMSSDSEAKKAIEMFDGKEFDGRTIKVNEARPQENRNDRGSFGSRSGGFNKNSGRY